VEFAVSPEMGQAVLACPTKQGMGQQHFPKRRGIWDESGFVAQALLPAWSRLWTPDLMELG
jgi:hypothetical protein